MFAAIDKNGFSVRFIAMSWDEAEGKANKMGYTQLGMLVAEISA